MIIDNVCWLDRKLTHSCIAPWIQPLNGGIYLELSAKVRLNASLLLISQAGATTTAPFLCASFINAFASAVCGPQRDRSRKCFAPREIIHLQMLRPRPPKPPDRTYVALLSNSYFGIALGTTYRLKLAREHPFASIVEVAYWNHVIFVELYHQLSMTFAVLH